MGYFINVLTTFLYNFLGLERGSSLAVYGGGGGGGCQKALGFHQKYLNLCSKHEGCMGLERHEGE